MFNYIYIYIIENKSNEEEKNKMPKIDKYDIENCRKF